MCSCGFGSARMRATVSLSLCLAATVFSGESRPSEGLGGWEQLNLSETTIAGTKVYYEKTLEPNLPAFERKLAKLAAGRETLANVVTRRLEIVADINRILGVTDRSPDGQAQMFVQLAGMLSKTKLTFYLATTTTIKNLLRGDVFSQGYLQSFLQAAVLLFRMGHEEAADQAMQNCLELYSRDSVTQGREAVGEAFIYYALNCHKPRKGEKMADELLAKAPEHVPALVVKMLVSKENGNKAAAQDYARRVLRLAKAPSAAYRAASAILGVDPNTPADYKESIGPK